MWPHRSLILSPLTTKTGAPKKGVKTPPFKWTPEIQKAFEEMKDLMAAEVLCAYPDHNKPIKYTLMHPIINLEHVQCKTTIQWPIFVKN
jgi:hypothetical protein